MADAEDDVGDAERTSPGSRLEFLDMRVRDCVRAVVNSSPEAGSMLRRYLEAARICARLRPALSLLSVGKSDWLSAQYDEDRTLRMEWAAAMRALEDDPEAPLPSGE